MQNLHLEHRNIFFQKISRSLLGPFFSFQSNLERQVPPGAFSSSIVFLCFGNRFLKFFARPIYVFTPPLFSYMDKQKFTHTIFVLNSTSPILSPPVLKVCGHKMQNYQNNQDNKDLKLTASCNINCMFSRFITNINKLESCQPRVEK